MNVTLALSLSAYCALTVCYALSLSVSLPPSLSSLCACLPVVIWSRLLECFEISSVRPSLSLSPTLCNSLTPSPSSLTPYCVDTLENDHKRVYLIYTNICRGRRGRSRRDRPCKVYILVQHQQSGQYRLYIYISVCMNHNISAIIRATDIKFGM